MTYAAHRSKCFNCRFGRPNPSLVPASAFMTTNCAYPVFARRQSGTGRNSTFSNLLCDTSPKRASGQEVNRVQKPKLVGWWLEPNVETSNHANHPEVRLRRISRSVRSTLPSIAFITNSAEANFILLVGKAYAVRIAIYHTPGGTYNFSSTHAI